MFVEQATFRQIANGVPGLELRLALLFSEGVGKGRLSLNEFVALTSTNPARIYGLHPRKGSFAVGADADLALWDPKWQRTVTYDMLHDKAGYTPYEGMTLTGWPRVVISRGRVVVEDEELKAAYGSGVYLQRRPEMDVPGSREPEVDPARNFGAELL